MMFATHHECLQGNSINQLQTEIATAAAVMVIDTSA